MTTEGEYETEEQLVARHKKENRDLIARVTGMKKQATKSKKKEVMRKCQELEEELQTRQKKEIAALKRRLNGDIDGENDEEEGDEVEEELTPAQLLAQLEISKKAKEEPEQKANAPIKTQTQSQEPKKKKNRAKERLARREAQLAEVRAEAQAEADEQPDMRAIEMANLAQLCDIRGLKQHDITPDGHCLFASIADQLKVRHGVEVSVQELRSRAARHMRDDPNTYAPFLFDEKTLTMRDVKDYTDEIENTALWGGDMEIMALAKEYDCPISVMISGAATLKINDDAQQPELKLVYYKHSFGLGEHYNSLRDAEPVN